MATTINVTTGQSTTSVNLSVGARGPAGTNGSDASVTNANVNAAIEDDPKASRDSLSLIRVVSSSTAAVLGETLHVVATSTITDPSPVEGKGFEVFVRNGTATVGSKAYSAAGTIIKRTFHSGSWSNEVYLDSDQIKKEREPSSYASTPPSGLTFSRAHWHRPIELLPAALERFSTRFNQIQTTATWRLESTGPLPTFEQGAIRFSGTQVAYASPHVQNWIAPNIITEVTVQATPASGIIGIGIGNAPLANNRTLIYYDRADNDFKLAETLNAAATVITTSGGNTIDLSSATNWKFAVAVYNNTAAAWIDRGNGYELAACFDSLVANNNRYLTPANLGGVRTFVLASSPGATAADDWVVTSYRAGYGGTDGIQNQFYITYEDGTPILDQEGKYYLIGSGNFPYRATTGNLRWKHSRNLIYKVDPSTFAIEVVGFVALQRGGVFANDDISGKCLYDRYAKKWRLYLQNSSQFDGGATAVVYQYTTTENILHGVSLITESALVEVPSTGLPYWDMDVLRRGENDWVFVYSERDTSSPSSALRSVIATGTTPDAATTQIYKEATLQYLDGSRIVKIGGTIYALFFSTSGPVVKDITTGSTITTLTFDGTWDSRTTRVTHCNIIGIPRGGVTYYILDGADDAVGYGAGYATYGNRVVWRTAAVAGNEYDVFAMPPRS